MAGPGCYAVISPCPDVLSGTAVENPEGLNGVKSRNYTKIKTWLSIFDHRLDHGIHRATAARPCNCCTGFWYHYALDFRTAVGVAGGVYQYLAPRTTMASL